MPEPKVYARLAYMSELEQAKQGLQALRARLLREIQQVEGALKAMGGASSTSRTTSTAGAPKSLREAVTTALKSSGAPMPLSALTESIRSAGFTSSAKNFRGNVSGMLTQMVKARQVKRTPEGYTVGQRR